MRINRLDLIAFGPFTDTVLDLSGGAEGFHLVYGPNEAGKSSALRAIHQLFCGILHQSTDSFFHKNADLRIGALLRDRDGESLAVVRRKGTKNTLLGSDGKAIDAPDARLARLLGGVAPSEFLKKFVIDHGELVDGGKSVIVGGGDLGSLLFAAGSGLTGLASVQKQLDDEAESLFKRGGSKPVINLKFAELEAKRKKINDDSLRGSKYREYDERLRAALARKDALERDLAAATRERDHLTRLAESFEPIGRRVYVLDELRGLADVPKLSADFTFRRRDAESRLLPSEKHAAEADSRISALTEEISRLDFPEPLLAEAEAISALHLRLGSHQCGRDDRDRLQAERSALENEARAFLRDLGRDVALIESADIEAIRLRAPDRAVVHDLANDRQVLFQATIDTAKALQSVDAKIQKIADKFASIGPGRDTSGLRKVVKKVQAQGDLDALLQADRDVLTRDVKTAGLRLKALGRWPGSLDALEALPIPSNETLDLFQADFDANASEADDLRRRLAENEAEDRSRTAEIDQLRLDGGVPTEEALAAARLDREAAWEGLKAAWDPRLVPSFERAVREADAYADRLRREARRVSDHARLVAEQTRLADTRNDLTSRLNASQDRLLNLQKGWLALWEPLGLDAPGRPREMLAWTRKASDLVTLAGSVREKSEAVSRREDQVNRLRRDLVEALESLGDSATTDESTAQLIDRSQDRIDAEARESKTRDRLKDDLDTLKTERPGRDEAAASARDAWERWRGVWADAMARLGLSATALPAEAISVLTLTVDLFDRLDRAKANRQRIEAIDREAGRFKSDAWTLADRVAPDLAIGKFDSEAATVALADRLAQARRTRQKLDDLTARLAEQTENRDASLAEVARARDELALLRREARCATDDALPGVEERSARLQKFLKERDDLNASLTKLSAGTPLETFLNEAGQTDRADLCAQLARLDDRLAELNDERETVNQTIGAERTQLALMDGSSRAADAGQEAEDLRARIKTDVEQYARLRLASAILRAGIERYRSKSQGPVLARASTLFSTLTLGSFSGLAVDYDDRDEPVLKGLRAGTGEPVGVLGMSLGTADQLYLSLRLAILETYLDRREALPLVVDDILIQFDNARASATLSALASFSRRTQVLLFTHHAHLRDLATKAVPGDLLFHHELPGRV